MGDATRGERFAEFLARLNATPAAADFDEVFRQVGDILDAVVDELTSIPADPDRW